MKNIYLLCLLTFCASYAQDDKEFLNRFLLEELLKPENKVDEYSHYDFSSIWLKTENHNILGVIGNDNQRLQIKLVSVSKNNENHKKYTVTGKSKVKGVICNFSGEIIIRDIYETKSLNYGVDSICYGTGIKTQGLLVAEYNFKENTSQKNSGIFKGTLYTKWHIDKTNILKYNDIQSVADGYLNNAYIGVWESYATGNAKKCNWADYRIPIPNEDFDIGAGEFSPSEKYYDKGWSQYQQAWLYGDEKAKKDELDIWWK
ncbi:hypothetical protein [Flavobacterium rhizosphaerae]|uniref:Uncharacterized protein n=1 Tax=Flavobacterium rhizosphaerae TaxID=3163298 RepID=A0ABW8YVL6_9FLAO